MGLEVLEDVVVDADVLAALHNLSAQGYIIALDDFFYQEHLRPLVELADIIKIDVLASGRRTVAEQVKLLRQYDVQLLAEKVETQEDFTIIKPLDSSISKVIFSAAQMLSRGSGVPPTVW